MRSETSGSRPAPVVGVAVNRHIIAVAIPVEDQPGKDIRYLFSRESATLESRRTTAAGSTPDSLAPITASQILATFELPMSIADSCADAQPSDRIFIADGR